MTLRKCTQKQWILILLFVVVVAGLSSCRTGRDLPARRLKPMASEKLLSKARENAFDFNDLTIRRINVQFSDGYTRTSFRANLKAAKDEKILASISKLNIPVGRVLLTPGGVTYVNYIDKNYYEGDYTYISKLLDFSLSFNIVQAIITNPVKTGIPEMNFDGKQFNTTVEDGKYVLQPVNQMNRTVSEQSRFFIRNHNNPNVLEEEDLKVSKMMFNPQSFVLEKLVMDDPFDNRRLEVDFSDFAKIDGYDYPGAIDVKMFSGNELTELNIKFKGLSTEKTEDVELNIPGNYQRIRPR
jgi:hypothetical protein